MRRFGPWTVCSCSTLKFSPLRHCFGGLFVFGKITVVGAFFPSDRLPVPLVQLEDAHQGRVFSKAPPTGTAPGPPDRAQKIRGFPFPLGWVDAVAVAKDWFDEHVQGHEYGWLTIRRLSKILSRQPAERF
ncbi:MAG: hypothetical protein JJU00_17900, partial [Opitutales bacterium]|nr:hypothetical protein [Opitutales bacterium]